VTLRERAVELLAEISALIQQLLGEVQEAEGAGPEPEENVDPRASSDPVHVGDCRIGGDHEEIEINDHTYCRKCNELLVTEGT